MTFRPPVGFIVEGHGEFHCYPSLFCRIVKENVHVPLINARGCGNIVKHLKEHLTDLFLSYSPLTVIVTIDLDDVLKQKLATTCVDLVQDLHRKIGEWRLETREDDRLRPLPNNVIPIVQVKKFESWLISDIEGLQQKSLLRADLTQIVDAEELAGPDKWLQKHLMLEGSVKNPKIAKLVTSALNPARMRLHSRSFDKFWRESVAAYTEWKDHNKIAGFSAVP